MKCLFKILLAMVATVMFAGCSVEEEYVSVPFRQLECTCLAAPAKVTKEVIYNQKQFEKKYKLTSNADLGDVFVISVVAPVTGKKTQVKIIEILAGTSALYVKYKITEAGEWGGSQVPHCTVAVSSDYSGYEVAFYDIAQME